LQPGRAKLALRKGGGPLCSTLKACSRPETRWLATSRRMSKLPYAERHIHSPRRAFGCFSLRILNDRAAASYQLLDLSLAGLPLDRLFLIADLSSFEVGVLVLSFLDNCPPLIIDLIQHLSFDYLVGAQSASAQLAKLANNGG
jgi:hypothetical protein